MVQSPLEICACRPAQGAMPLLRPTYIEYEQLNTSPRYNVMGKYTQKCRPNAARAEVKSRVSMQTCNILDRDRGGDRVARRTSSGAAEYSVLGSFASSRASCMMRLTAR